MDSSYLFHDTQEFSRKQQAVECYGLPRLKRLPKLSQKRVDRIIRKKLKLVLDVPSKKNHDLL